MKSKFSLYMKCGVDSKCIGLEDLGEEGSLAELQL